MLGWFENKSNRKNANVIECRVYEVMGIYIVRSQWGDRLYLEDFISGYPLKTFETHKAKRFKSLDQAVSAAKLWEDTERRSRSEDHENDQFRSAPQTQVWR